jgi:putative transposase
MPIIQSTCVSRTAHASRLRTGRFSEPGRIYLVTTATHQRQPFFFHLHVGRLIVNELRRVQQEGKARSMAWVIMPDHLHWLLELESASLEGVVKQVKAASAVSINRAIGHEGPLWQRGFHDRALRYDDDLAAAARYVILNPVRAGLVKRVGDYPLWDAIWV